MVQRMLVDLSIFIALILLVLIGFGIAAQGVSAHRFPFDSLKLFNIFYRYDADVRCDMRDSRMAMQLVLCARCMSGCA